MNGLLFPEEGTIKINGQQLTEDAVWEIRKDIGMVFQNPDNQFVGATVQDDVAFGLENRGIERNEMIKRIDDARSEEHTSELQSRGHLVCRLLLEKKKERVR